MAGTVEGVITGPAALKVGLAALLRRYRPAEGQSWLSAKLTVELTTHEESFTVANSPPPPSSEGPGNPAWDSANQNHEGCPGGQSRNSSSEMGSESSFQIENIEMPVEVVGGIMPLSQASGSDATISTTYEIDVKLEERVEDWTAVDVTSVQNTDPMTDERAEGTPLDRLDDFTDMPDLSMEPQIDVKAESPQNREYSLQKGTGGEITDTEDDDDDDCDETGNSEDELMVNLAISNVRSLPDPPVTRARNRHDQPALEAHVDTNNIKAKEKVKNLCDVCGKLFSSPFSLSRHMSSIHDGPKRKRPTGKFKNKECGSAYKYKDPMTDERAEGESLTLDDFTDMPDLSMEPQIDVKAQSLQATEDEGTGGEGMETNDFNYESDSSDENGRDSEDEPMVNLAMSNARALPESAVKTPNLPGVAHLDKTEAKNQPKNSCNVCEKGFSNKYTLRRHVSNIHEGPKRKRPTEQFKCKKCRNKYKYKHVLTQHMRIHQADCPFRCNLCQRPCISKGDLERHMRTHTGERPFLCPTCNKGYSRKDKLKLHRCAS